MHEAAEALQRHKTVMLTRVGEPGAVCAIEGVDWLRDPIPDVLTFGVWKERPALPREGVPKPPPKGLMTGFGVAFMTSGLLRVCGAEAID